MKYGSVGGCNRQKGPEFQPRRQSFGSMFCCDAKRHHNIAILPFCTIDTAPQIDMTAPDHKTRAHHERQTDGSNATFATRLSESIWLCAFLMLGLVVMSRSLADPDLWGHVTYGKEVIRDGHLHETTTWSYAVTDFRWINHENIAELLLAFADTTGGQQALLLLKSILAIIVLGVPLVVARRSGAGLLTCFVLVIILALNISFHWLARPHMVSYACASVMLGLLAVGLRGAVTDRPAGTNFSRWLWGIPVVMCFWTNAHGGYLAGLAILTAWLGLDALELGIKRDPRFGSTVLHHAGLFLITVLACMINPYGLELHQWMLSSLGRPRPEITEWAPLPLFTLEGLPFWALLCGGFMCLRHSRQAVRWPGIIVTGLITWQAVKHYRHLPFVALIATYVLAPHVEACLKNLQVWLKQRLTQGKTGNRGSNSHLPWAMPLAILTLLTCLQYPRQSVMHVDKGFYPVSAMQFMADHDLNGRVFVTFNWAQYALTVFAEQSPESRIAIDGRFRTCYPQDVIDMYFDFILGDVPQTEKYREDASGKFDPTRALEFGNPNLVLFERRRENCVATMEGLSDKWCLLYQDSLAQLWGRRTIYDVPSSNAYLPVSERHLSDDIQEGAVAWPAMPVRDRHSTRVALAE